MKEGFQAHINACSLAFEIAEMERGFVECHKEQLQRSVFGFNVLATTVCLYLYLIHHRYWDLEQYETRAVLEVSGAQFQVQAVGLGGTIVVLGFLIRLSRCGMLSTPRFEAGVVCAFTLAQSISAISLKPYIAKVCGYDDPDLWGIGINNMGAVEAQVLMWNSFCQGALFIMMPIRWKTALPFGLFSILSYALPAYLVGTPAPKMAAVNLLALCSLSVLLCFGKRFDELKERELHWSLLREKRLRFQAEFALSTATSAATSPQKTMATSATGSVSEVDHGKVASLRGPPSTTPTGQVFEAVCEGAAASVEQLVELGRREQWMIVAEEVQRMPEVRLGHGGFGCVIKGVYKGAEVALKFPRPEKIGAMSKRNLTVLCNELRIMRHLRHPNIVTFHGAVIATRKNNTLQIGLVLEFISGGTLEQFLDKKEPAVDATRTHLLLGVSSALCHLHSRTPPIVHGDLKPANIFVESGADGGPAAKLLDFGLSRLATKRARPMGGTLRWMAPELLRSAECKPHPSTDVFSFGRIIFFAVAARRPFGEKSGKQLKQLMLMSPVLTWPDDVEALPLGKTMTYLVEQCAQEEPLDRPDVPEVHACLAAVSRELGAVGAGGLSEPPAVSKSGLSSALEGSIFQASEPEPRTESRAHPGGLPREGSPCAGASARKVSEANAQTCSAAQLMEASFLPTPKSTVRLRLEAFAWQCNFERPVSCCCRYHASLEALQAVIEEQRAVSCIERGPAMLGQCPSCRTMSFDYGEGAVHDDTCEFCGERIVPRGQPFPPTPEASSF